MMAVRRATLVVLLVLATLAPSARAQTSDAEKAAQVLFDEGMRLMDTGDYAAACPKLEESQRVDPGMGTKFRLAECYEQMKRVTSAWTLFVEVDAEARTAGLDERADLARARAEALLGRLPKLVIDVPPAIAALEGLTVTRDDRPVAGTLFGRPIPVDPGEHVVSAVAPGRAPFEARVTANEQQTVTVTVIELRSTETEPVVTPPPAEGLAPRGSEPPPPPEEPASDGTEQRVAAVAVGVVGLIGLTVGTIYGLSADSTYDDALAQCEDEDPTRCDGEAQAAGDDASTEATISTIAFGVGAAALVGAAVLWLTAPTGGAGDRSGGEVALVPAVGAGEGGLWLRGAF